MNKTVIFLGAGASAADGAPLQNQLFKSFVNASHDNRYKSKCTRIKNEINDFFELFFGFNIDSDLVVDGKVDFSTFEEALGILDLAISKNEEFRGGSDKLEQFRIAIVSSMALAIEYELDINKDYTSNQMNYHSMLVNKLYSDSHFSDFTFLSTNYDLLIDNALFLNTTEVNYGFESEDESEKMLLKLHGSLNWLYCPVCKRILSKTGQKVMTDVVTNNENVKCCNCDTMQQYMVIPPTYFKEMSNVYLTNIWNNAERKLTEANHIIFCGYSFPEADIHIKYLLKRAEVNRKDKTLKISIINNFVDKSVPDSINEKERYTRFFNKNTEVDYTNMSFQDFTSDPRQILI